MRIHHVRTSQEEKYILRRSQTNEHLDQFNEIERQQIQVRIHELVERNYQSRGNI